MAGETIRDVVIKLKLEVDKAKVEPDISPFVRAAEEMEKRAKQIHDSIGGAGSVEVATLDTSGIADAVDEALGHVGRLQDELSSTTAVVATPDFSAVDEALAQVISEASKAEEALGGIGDAKVQPNFDAATKGAATLASELEDTEAALEGSIKKMESWHAKLAEEQEKARQELDDLSTTAVDQSIKMGQSFTQASEGLLTMSRGVVFLGVSSEKDLAPVIQSLAQIQGCHDDRTDLLTPRGWIAFTDLQEADEVATLSRSGVVEYQTPTAVHRYDFDGEMVRVKSPRVDFLVTPNHRMLVRPWAFVEASSLDERDEWSIPVCDDGLQVEWVQVDREHISKERYAGVVWCLSVPNETLVTRRNGVVGVSGNSIDLLKGASDTFAGITETVRSFRAATAAAAAASTVSTGANAALAASNTAVATTGAAATASMVALSTAAAPLLLLIGASAGLAVLADKIFGPEGEGDFEERTKEATERTGSLIEQIRQLQALEGLRIERSTRRAELEAETESMVRQVEVEARSLTIAEQIRDVESERATAAQRLREDLASFSGSIEFDFQRGTIDAAKKSLEEFAATLSPEGPTRNFIQDEELKRVALITERILEHEQQQVDQRRLKIDLLQRERDEQLQIVKLSQEVLRNAEKQAEAAQRSVESAEARFGRLEAEDQLSAVRLAKKLQGGGDLSTEEARFAEQIGFFQNQAEAAFRQRGQAAGADLVIDLSDAGEQQAKAFEELAAAQAHAQSEFVQGARRAVQEGNEQIREEQKALVTAIREMQSFFAGSLLEFRDELEERSGFEAIRNRPAS